MERQKNYLEKELAAQLNKRADEKEALRQEMKKERENMAAMVWVGSFSVYYNECIILFKLLLLVF